MKHDVLHALRHLRKHPGYTLVTLLTLALGIGANTAIFSVVNGVLLKPLPYLDPSRLVLVTSQFPALGFDHFWVSAPEFLEFRERNRAFAEVGAYRAGAVNLGTQDRPRRVNSALVTSELLPVLGVPAVAGRHFTREDTLPGAEDVTILSDEIWRTAFGGGARRRCGAAAAQLLEPDDGRRRLQPQPADDVRDRAAGGDVQRTREQRRVPATLPRLARASPSWRSPRATSRRAAPRGWIR